VWTDPPAGLGELIASKIPDGRLKEVRVYRGIPSNARDPQGYAAVRKHTAAWAKQDPNRIHVYHRPLQYLPAMISEQMGHADYTITLRTYARLIRETDRTPTLSDVFTRPAQLAENVRPLRAVR
jgi:integrase